MPSLASRREEAARRREREARKAALYAELAREAAAGQRPWSVHFTSLDALEALLLAARLLCILLTL